MKQSYHNHTRWSDGFGRVEDLFFFAENLGLAEIGVSDHFLIAPNSKKHLWAMPENALDDYIQDVKTIPTTVKVKLGLEVDFFPESVEIYKKIFSEREFDYLIGSVHVVDGVPIDQAKALSQEHFNSVWINRYWKLIKQMAQSGLFDIVGHIDLTKKFGFKSEFDHTKVVNEAFEEIAKANMTVELNTSGWFYPCKEQYPSVDLLSKCKEYNIPVMVNADAHDPSHLTRRFSEAYELLTAMGIREQPSFDKRKKTFNTFV